MRTSRRFKAFVVALAALCLSVGLASAVSADAQTNPTSQPSPELLAQLKAQAQGEVTVSTETSTKYFGFIRVSAGGDLLPGTSGSPEAKAQAFLAKYGSLLGVGDAAGSLVEADVETDEQDATHVTYAQSLQGRSGLLRRDQGACRRGRQPHEPQRQRHAGPQPERAPRLSPEQAGQRAIAHVIADPPRDENGDPVEFLTAAE